MNKKDRLSIAHAANGILFLWKELILEAQAKEPDPMKRCWYRQDVRQAYQNSLNTLKLNGLIEDYDVEKVQVKIDGVWTAAKRVLVL